MGCAARHALLQHGLRSATTSRRVHVMRALPANAGPYGYFSSPVKRQISLYPAAPSTCSTWDMHVDETRPTAGKLPPEVAVQNFFKRVEVIARIANLLKSMPWGKELQAALKKLPVVFDTQLVTQVLRIKMPDDVALSFFHWLKNVDGFEHTQYTMGVMLNSLGRSGHFKGMQELFYALKSEGRVVSPVILSNVMLWLLKWEDTEGVARIWRELSHQPGKKRPAAYTAYIDHLVRKKQYKQVRCVYEEMLKEDVIPGSRLHTILVQHLVEAGKVEAAARILKIMLKMHLVPNRVTYELVINGSAKMGKVDLVLELLDEMREFFRRPTKNLLPTLTALNAAAKSNEAKRLTWDIWPQSALCDTNASTHSYEQFEDDDADPTEEDGELSDWRYVARLHVGFDIIAFTQALTTWNSSVEDVLEQAHVQWQNALVLAILKHLKSLKVSWNFCNWLKDRVHLKHDVYTCALMTCKILKSTLALEKKAVLVDKLFTGMRTDGVELTVPMFNMVIHHYVEVGEAEKALEMFMSIKDFGLEPNKFSYAYAIQGLTHNRQGKKAVKLMKAMREAGFELDSITRARLITCLGLAGKAEKAYALFQEVLVSEGYADAHVYKAIMANYLRIGDVNMAVKLYEEMRENGIPPTQGMYYVVTAILRRAKRYTELDEILAERRSLDFLGGKNKRLQESLLEILYVFLENMIIREVPASVQIKSRKRSKSKAEKGKISS